MSSDFVAPSLGDSEPELTQCDSEAVNASGEVVDGVVVNLRALNIATAVSLGIVVGQAAILDVLGIGPKVLGERKR